MKLSDLKKVFAPITALGRRQVTVHIADTPVVLRLLSSQEQIDVNSQMSRVLEESGLDTFGQISQYVGSESIETLSRSISKVGDFDFSDVQTVETGELLPTGVPVTVSKVEAVRMILEGWNPTLLGKINEAYQTFLTESESLILSQVVVSELDIDTELSALKGRISELEARKAKTIENLKIIQGELHKRQLESLSRREVEEEAETGPEVDPEQMLPPRPPLSEQIVQSPITPRARMTEAPPPMGASPTVQAPPAWIEEETFVDPGDMDAIAAANNALMKKRNPRFR